MTSSNGNIFPRYWPFVRGIHRLQVNSPHKGQWCGALMFSLIWMNGWVNNGDTGDLRHCRAHYDVTVMSGRELISGSRNKISGGLETGDDCDIMICDCDMMTSWNGNIFRFTGLLCGEFIGHRWIPRSKASDTELWFFIWSAPAQTVQQAMETPVMWDAIALIMTSLKWNTLPAKLWIIWHFVLLEMTWYQPQTNIKTLMQLSCVVSVLDENCNLQCPKLKWHIRMYRTVSFWNTSLKIARASIIRLWIFGNFVCVQWCFIWHHTKFATGCRITIWALKQNSKMVWLKVQYLVIWYHIENLLHLCMTHVYWNQGKPGPKY